MNKTLAATFVTLAVAALVTGMTTMTTQVANAQGNSDSAYGKSIIKPNAQAGGWGQQVSDAAQDEGPASTHKGLGDWRSNGCKVPDRGTGNLC